LDLGGEYYKLYTSQFRREDPLPEDLPPDATAQAPDQPTPGGDGRRLAAAQSLS
jgi:hypothetical protein